MKQETEPIRRPSMKQEVANMNDALAQMRRSRRIHFFKSLPKSAIQKGERGKYAELTLPAQFVQENCHKIEEWVILRAQLSRGKSSRPWLEEARSEFEVHLFRGPQGSPYFPDEGENSPIDDEGEQDFVSASEDESYSSSLGHHENGKASPFRNTKTLEKLRTYPGFRKRLTASSIKRCNVDSYTGQFEFPWSFVKTHGNQLHGSVQLQGIHEDSPTYSVTCRWRPQRRLKVSFVSSEWVRFVKENGLKSGHELQFSLVDESYFVVRKV